MMPFVEQLLGLDVVTDQVVAMDLLVAAKAAIKDYAAAATETGTPETKAILTKHLHEAIDSHAKLTDLMIERGWYQPYDVPAQIGLDQANMETALNLPG